MGKGYKTVTSRCNKCGYRAVGYLPPQWESKRKTLLKTLKLQVLQHKKNEHI